MHFVMYLNGQQVDSVPVLGTINVSHLMDELRSKHKDLLKSAGTEPVFALEQVASHVDGFKPLKLPTAAR